MSKLPPLIAAIPWYTRAAYPRVLEVMQDRDILPRSYDEWLARAEVVVEQARRHGRLPVKSEIDPERFLGWCKARGLDPDSDARAAFIEAPDDAAAARSRAPDPRARV